MATQLPGSSIWVELADPESPELDDLDLGPGDGLDIASYFASRWWVAHPEPPALYRFVDNEGRTVGFALIEETPMPHPDRMSDTEELYLLIRLFGVLASHQDTRDPRTERSYASGAMRAIDELILPTTDAVGTMLVVREGNDQARGLYERANFDYDASDRFWRDGDWWLLMRKPRV